MATKTSSKTAKQGVPKARLAGWKTFSLKQAQPERSVRAEIGGYAEDVFLTEPEAAEACGVSPHTLKCWRLAREGKGPPAVKVYDMVRYRAADVRAWLKTMAEAV
jgi:predicted DNA-binding transcriptional regulator AlpA